MKIFVAFCLLIPAAALGQEPGSRVYVNRDNPFANYFSAGVAKKKVPVVLTADRGAQYAIHSPTTRIGAR